MKLARSHRLVLTCAGALGLAGLVSFAFSVRQSLAQPAPPPGHPAVSAPGGELTPEKRRQLEASRDGLKSGLAKTPEDAELWRRLGFVYQNLGEVQEARSAFERLVSLKPEDEGGWFMLALIHEKLGAKAQAVAAWESVLRLAKVAKHREVAQKHLKHLRERP